MEKREVNILKDTVSFTVIPFSCYSPEHVEIKSNTKIILWAIILTLPICITHTDREKFLSKHHRKTQHGIP